jgi:hypothetical protein
MKTTWKTPVLVSLASGAEAQANKNQWFTEASRGCEPVSEGEGCPGNEDGEEDDGIS